MPDFEGSLDDTTNSEAKGAYLAGFKDGKRDTRDLRQDARGKHTLQGAHAEWKLVTDHLIACFDGNRQDEFTDLDGVEALERVWCELERGDHRA